MENQDVDLPWLCVLPLQSTPGVSPMPGLMWRQCRTCKASLNWIGKGCSMQGYVLSPWWWHKVATAPRCAVQMLFKVSVLTFKDLHGTGASYLRDHISVIEHNLTQQLHSTRTINVGQWEETCDCGRQIFHKTWIRTMELTARWNKNDY